MSANRSSSYSGALVDPSNLHLKKELTQIKKAARVLRDPGTTSSRRSPLASSRSTGHYNHHYRNTSGYSVEEVIGSNVNGSNGNVNSVFLYNWRTQRSESERSVSVRHQQRRSDGFVLGYMLVMYLGKKMCLYRVKLDLFRLIILINNML
ncbi:hypothetical protein Hanom_Chr09g00793981 [Helianthus anomalus]